MTVSVTTLIENSAPENKSLAYQHGLSFHIATPETNFLFDCGANDKFMDNAVPLNVDLNAVDFVVCSHAHYDHCGGFRHLVRRHPVRRLITGGGFFRPKYARDGLRHTFLGADFDARFLAENGIRHQEAGDIMQLDAQCWLVGNFHKDAAWSGIPPRFVVRNGEQFLPDPFADEICLAVRFEDGVAVLVGCSHPGVMNILHTVRDRIGLPIRGVWGGTHLSEAENGVVADTLRAMKELGVRHFGLSHCSGDTMLARIQSDPEITGCRLRTGDGIFLGAQ